MACRWRQSINVSSNVPGRERWIPLCIYVEVMSPRTLFVKLGAFLAPRLTGTAQNRMWDGEGGSSKHEGTLLS